MFHAPTNETKQQSERAQTQLQRGPHFSASPPFAPSYAPARGGQSLAYLHSTYGNQAVLRMLSHSTPAIQAKLAINKPGDEFEQEADRVADQVMRMTAPALSLQRKCSGCEEEEKLQRKCGECVEEEKKKETEIQRKEASLGGEIAPPIVHDVLRSPGQPIDPSTRSFMEPRFGYDFSAVRVHTDGPAAESARAVNAFAYTHGRNVVFGAGQYSPQSESGRQLLAHELAHVVQQSGEVGLRLYRKELPDEEIPKEWPLPNPATEGTEQCRWEEGDLKCYKVMCVQTEEDKTHCYYDGPYTSEAEPEKKASAPKAKTSNYPLSDAGLNFIALPPNEGFCPNLYDDLTPNCGRGKGNCTIGIGRLIHNGPCTEDDDKKYKPVTKEAEAGIFKNKLTSYIKMVNDNVKVELTQCQFDAMVSFAYNANKGGLDELLPTINDGKYNEMPDLIRKTRINSGILAPRRNREADLFANCSYKPTK